MERKFVLAQLLGKKIDKPGLRFIIGAGYGDGYTIELPEVVIECSPLSDEEGLCFKSVYYNECEKYPNPNKYCCWTGETSDSCYFG